MRFISLVAITCLTTVQLFAQTDVPPISGWTMQEKAGHYLFAPPPSVIADFVYELVPPIKGPVGTMNTWFKQVAENDIKAQGYQITPSTKYTLQAISSYITYTVNVPDASGKSWNLAYMAYERPNKTVRYAKVTAPGGPGVLNPEFKKAVAHFINFSKDEGVTLPAKNADGANTSTTPAPEKNIAKKTTTPLTAPGQGLKPSAIKGIVMNMEYGTGVGGMLIVEYRPYLLLNDGTIYKYIKVSPYDLDVAASRQAEVDKWGTWKQEGKTLVVQLPQKKGGMETKRWAKNWFWAKAATPNERIKGAYKTIGGGGNTALGGSSMIVVAGNISFNEKGQFIYAKMASGSNSDFGVATTTTSSKSNGGTYTLNGYNIELHYSNGQVTRQLFYFYPDSHEAFGMGGSDYVPAK